VRLGGTPSMKDRDRLRPTCLASTEGDGLHERDQRQDASHPGEREGRRLDRDRKKHAAEARSNGRQQDHG